MIFINLFLKYRFHVSSLLEDFDMSQAFRPQFRPGGTLVGDRAFYSQVVSIVVPIVIQNTVSNVVSLLDNVMVGAVGTLEMSSVAIVNQLLFVFYLCGYFFYSVRGCKRRAGRSSLLQDQMDDRHRDARCCVCRLPDHPGCTDPDISR